MYDKAQLLYKIDEHKKQIKDCRDTQKWMRKGLGCMTIPYDQFRVNGTFNEGNDMFKNVAILSLRAFDDKCAVIINKLKISNISKSLEDIKTAYEQNNTNTATFNISIKADYYALKLDECRYTFDLLLAQEQQKQIEKTEKEIIKEQLKEEKALEREKERAERERMNLQYKLTRAELNDRTRIKEQIDGLTEIIDHNEFMLSHKRCGYVYVVSNNDMKEGQYKIGITRRTVEERMKELGSGASHSFPMNVHGYVYCDDCFQVESAMHRHFANRRVNQVNAKKEWFYASLEEIAQGFKDVCNIDIKLVDAVDESYLYSQERLNV